MGKYCFDYTITGIEVDQVLLGDEQYTLECGENAGVPVNWFYRKQPNATPIPIADLGDTSYIVNTPYLYLTNIKPRHEGFYSCDQMPSTLYHLVVYGKWEKYILHSTLCIKNRYTKLSSGIIIDVEICHALLDQHHSFHFGIIHCIHYSLIVLCSVHKYVLLSHIRCGGCDSHKLKSFCVLFLVDAC